MPFFHPPKSWRTGRPSSDDAPMDESDFWNRREILRTLGVGGVAALAGAGSLAVSSLVGCRGDDDPAYDTPALHPRFESIFRGNSAERTHPAYGRVRPDITPQSVASRYNNFYEFTQQKSQVWRLAQRYPTIDDWDLEVTGLVAKPRRLALEEVLTVAPLEERQYRFRCVERWSMQVPWLGYPLRSLIDRLGPLPSARYVRFVSRVDREHMPGTRNRDYHWPYFEALRLDEARHDLAFLALGIYGRAMPMQHGAPFRVVTPWKYGYKSPKSIVAIEFTDRPPNTFWHREEPEAYGLYSNVDPTKRHPRWSQAVETDIGTGRDRATLLLNGYADAVSHLYTGREDQTPTSGWDA